MGKKDKDKDKEKKRQHSDSDSSGKRSGAWGIRRFERLHTDSSPCAGSSSDERHKKKHKEKHKDKDKKKKKVHDGDMGRAGWHQL